MIMIKTPGSQMGSQAAAEGGGEARGGRRRESRERSGVQAGSTLESTVPKARSRSREGATLDEARRISRRVSSQIPSSALSSLSTVITALAQTPSCPSTTAAFARILDSSLTPRTACCAGVSYSLSRARALRTTAQLCQRKGGSCLAALLLAPLVQVFLVCWPVAFRTTA